MPLRRDTLLALVALLFSGLVQPLISAPHNLYWLHPWALAPGLYVLCQLSAKRAFFGGWLMGMAANLGIFYWFAETVSVFGKLPYVVGLAALLLFAAVASLYSAFFGWGLGYLRAVSGPAWPFAAAAWFVTCEFLNPQLFPYYHGISLYRVPELFLVTSVTGVLGLSFQMILWNLLLVAAAEHRRGIGRLNRRGWQVSALVVALMFAATLGISAWQSGRIEAAEAQASSLRIAIVQPNLDIPERRRIRAAGAARRHVEQSRAALETNPEIDVFLWSEGALRRSPSDSANLPVFDFIRESRREIWTGARTVEQIEGEKRFYNAAYLLRRDGSIGKRYDKIKLLPFGEYVPFVDLFPVLGRLPGTSHFTAGQRVTLLDSETSARASFLICYEAILREFVRRNIPDQANLIVNITYDAWFGDTSCASQHLMMAAARSAELGMPMVRAATTGISAVVDARGVITHQTAPFTEETLVADVRPVRVPTLYGTLGDWFPSSATLVSLSLLLLYVIRNSRGGL
ncbi:MAG: apolipoprotein N-acyltransferase [Deltaproteobacteria bacterium]|jgi:apolipoprotein N-acyltransferase|nr:apolipoprotein N-acyltransferase [Deltaproteobacteria bacterium]